MVSAQGAAQRSGVGLVLVGAAALAVVLWRSAQERRTQRDLWTEVTDPLP